MFSTRFFFGGYTAKQTHEDYNEIRLELQNIGHILKEDVEFVKDSNCERANSSYILANQVPIIVARLQAVKWFEGSGEISLWACHSTPDQKFLELENIAQHYGLTRSKIVNNFANRRS